MLGCRDLTVRLGGRVALGGVSFDLPPGTVTAVVGGDGAGKTTLLRALVGAVRPSSGTVRRPPPLRIGYMSAGPGVYGDLTVDENIGFVAAAYGVRGPVLERRRIELLDATGLAVAHERLAAHLSGGMRQKLAFALAVLHRPELVVLDEPTTGVDPVSRAELWRLVATTAATGATVVLATTYLDEAERAATVLVLDHGCVLVEGSPDAVMASVPGVIVASPRRLDAQRSWRTGAGWRTWCADGRVPDGSTAVTPGLEDAVIVASLRRAAEQAAA